MPRWIQEEEELFEKAWKAYDKYDDASLEEIFGRTMQALTKKAEAMGLENRSILKQLARVEAIKKALQEDHVI